MLHFRVAVVAVLCGGEPAPPDGDLLEAQRREDSPLGPDPAADIDPGVLV